ncbi:MAG: hypothetical protein ABIC96_00940 [Patescibacteria group bacterium]
MREFGERIGHDSSDKSDEGPLPDYPISDIFDTGTESPIDQKVAVPVVRGRGSIFDGRIPPKIWNGRKSSVRK